LKPFWKWFLRVTTAATMLLFLAPTAYVIKYYGVDKPREDAASGRALSLPTDADALPAREKAARQSSSVKERIQAIGGIGLTLRSPGIGWKRPLECLAAKATLADLATRDPDPAVRAAASEELGRVAQNGAVIRR